MRPLTSLSHTLPVPSAVYVPSVAPSVGLDHASLDCVLVWHQAPGLEADQVFAEAVEVEEWALNVVNEMVGVDVDERWVAVVGIGILGDFVMVDRGVVKDRPLHFASTRIHPSCFSDGPHCQLEQLVAFQRQLSRNQETFG